MSWAGVVKNGRHKTPSYAAAVAAPVAKTKPSRQNAWTQPGPAAPGVLADSRITAGRKAWSNPALSTTPGATRSLIAGVAIDCTSSPDQSLECNAFPALNSSGDFGSPRGSLSSSHSTAISISPKPTHNGSGHGRKSGKPQKNAHKSKLAEDIQSAMHHNSFQKKCSPEKDWNEQRRQKAIANGTVLTHMHIGAGLVGKCAGFGPRKAQTEALERLLSEQNPANWEATIAKHQQVTEAEQVQQRMAQHCPAMLSRLQDLQQLAALPVLPEAKQHHTAAMADIKACLEAKLNQQQAAEVAQAASEAHAADVAQAASEAHAAELVQAAPEAHATEPHDPATALSAQTATAANNTDEASAATVQRAVAAVVEGQISHTGASNAVVNAVYSSLDGSDIAQSLQLLEYELSGSVWSSLTTCSASTSETDTSEQATVDSSADVAADSQTESVASEPVPLLTEADVQMVLDYAQRVSNRAYGVQAEHDHIKELASQQAQHAQDQNCTWHKMGAPDNKELGVEYSGLTFELGCQVDRGLLHKGSDKAVPVELKNRTKRFAQQIPGHERVQVQAQMQLCNAPMAVLVERLVLSDGSVQCKEHKIRRDDFWWEKKVLPALYRFLAVFAKLATQQEELDLYVSKRASQQHHNYLKDLIKQQAITPGLPALF